MGNKKHYANVPIVKSTDDEGHLEMYSKGNNVTFLEDGTMVHNTNNDILTWNCGSVTHLNFMSHKLMIMFDFETNLLTITDCESDKNIWYDIDTLRNLIAEDGLTVEGMEMLLAAEEKAEENKNNTTEDKNDE